MPLTAGAGMAALAFILPVVFHMVGLGSNFLPMLLPLLLRFAFDELNLHRLSVWPSADNLPFIQMVEKAGFEEEARRREASFHDGSYWDVLHLGLLRTKWEKKL